MPSVCHRQDCVPTRFLLRFTNISGPARWSTCPDEPAEFARQRLVRFTVILITPNTNFQDSGADLAMSLERRPKTPAPPFGREAIGKNTSPIGGHPRLPRRRRLLH